MLTELDRGHKVTLWEMACHEQPRSNRKARKLCVKAVSHAHSLVDNSSTMHIYVSEKSLKIYRSLSGIPEAYILVQFLRCFSRPSMDKVVILKKHSQIRI